MESPLQQILAALAEMVKEGQTGKAIDSLATVLLRAHGCEPAFLGFKPDGSFSQEGYPAVMCVSINNEVIHGIPDDRKFQWGDVVSLDLGVKLPDGQYDDGAVTVGIDASATGRRLIKATREAMEAGVKAAAPGRTTFDVARAIKAVADRERFSVVHGYGGHGIGTELHMPPYVPNEPVGKEEKLEPGMRLAIEPMFATNRGDAYIDKNRWTVKVRTGLAAHFERTITV